MAKLIHAVSIDEPFLAKAISPVAIGDPFFGALLTMQRKITPGRCLPLLIMRSDFMDDEYEGPKLIEFNSIAAGMGPFGQLTHELHRYLADQWPEDYSVWSLDRQAHFVDNPAIARLSDGIVKTINIIKEADSKDRQGVFLMVIQENEDNVFDQHLLEYALHAQGIKTVRRTFRELEDNLSTGGDGRLLLDEVGVIDCVYYRTGYDHCDYVADDLHSTSCCQKLMQTRVFIENHRVAVNATVNQQLATSKSVQMILSSMSIDELTAFNLSHEEAIAVKKRLGEMVPLSEQAVNVFKSDDPKEWVLKNQGEGGGNCIFGQEILPTLMRLSPKDYSAWSLMKRVHPKHRSKPALVVKKGELTLVDDLISELGIFTVHVDGEPAVSGDGYAGYLLRSKSAKVSEGGIHSGMGVLDSLTFSS